MAETFTSGDQVVLKSGGPKMTVTEHDTELDLVSATWFDKTDKLHTENFIADALKRIPAQD
jgi:uncharacterized protein YodC (DUF2158 family)